MAGITLVIAEKPSVAGDITKALEEESFIREKSYYKGDKTYVSYAVGHLLSILEPQEMDVRYKAWKMEDLPILPDEYPLKPLESVKSQLNVLVKLIKKPEVVHIINACDAGREGELIFRYIIEYVEQKGPLNKKLSRLWLQSLTKEAIREGFKRLRKNEDLVPLSEAARSRSEADWLIGINGSRGLTAYISQHGGFFITPCGRVQTPTLSVIVEREQERQDFISESYWQVVGHFTSQGIRYAGKWFQEGFKKDSNKPHASPLRLWKKEEALDIIRLCTGKEAVVVETVRPSVIRSPGLYDLTTLQREAYGRFGVHGEAYFGDFTGSLREI